MRRFVVVGLLFCSLVSLHHAAFGQGSTPRPSRWVGNTSGPFYTGTADVEPRGSYYAESYLFNYRAKGASNYYVPTKFAIGLGAGMEFDVYAPFSYNRATSSQRTPGPTDTSIGYGDTLFEWKWQFAGEKERYRFWTMPSMNFFFGLNVPTGQYRSSNPNFTGASQTSNGTWNEQFNFLLRKEFKPFELYLQETELIQNPTNVTGHYLFNNGLTFLPAGEHLHMVDGNVLQTSGALEQVLLPKRGFGYLVEYNAERQFGRSLLFGKANAPSFSYVDLSPELEVAWPSKGKYPITWGAGTTFTAARSNYPRQLTPMFTVSFYVNRNGSR